MNIIKSPVIPSRNYSALLLVDFQEKLIPAIFNSRQITKNLQRIIPAFNLLGVKIFFTEQNPEKLGSTLPSVRDGISQKNPYIKTTFSIRDIPELWQEFSEQGVKHIILAGIESHVCVMQSALDLLANGYRVCLLADATGSRFEENYRIALSRMRHAGVDVSTTESVIFELLEDFTVPEFREILTIIK